MPPKSRRALACKACRAKKIRCNGGIPCANCQDRAEECIVIARRRPRQATTGNEGPGDLVRRLRQVEDMLQSTVDGAESPAALSGRELQVVGHQKVPDIVPYQSRESPASTGPLQPRMPQLQPLTFLHYEPHQQPPVDHDVHRDVSTSPINTDRQEKDQEDGSVYATETPNLEYYGPRSFMSFCSRPAVDWICSRLKSSDFRRVATLIVTDVAKMLKLSSSSPTSRIPDPKAEDAWKYSNAFFEEALEQAFCIVERPRFESRLRAHLSGTMPDDKAWYALRNIVLATGCKMALAKTVSFSEASRPAWGFFENSLSVYTEAIFLRGSFMSVQALILLAYFSEGLGNTSLQYMLCSVAVRFACSKGLHRRPARSWDISPQDITHRNWLFWSIYCLEKQNCSRSGRPSVMDDDEISCQVPPTALSGKLGDTIYCHILVDLTRLTSSARKRLSSARALRQTPAELLEAVRSLRRELDKVKRCAERRGFSLDMSLETDKLPNNLTLGQAQSLQGHYISLVMDINMPLAYPWSSISSFAKGDAAALAQVEASAESVASVSRSAILATRQIHIDASCSSLIALYIPIYSFINLFICMLRGSADAKSDLVILDIAQGYFSSLAYKTDFQLSMSFTKDLCQFAHLAVNQESPGQEKASSLNNTERTPTSNTLVTHTPSYYDAYSYPYEEYDSFGWFLDETEEQWSTLLPCTALSIINDMI